MPYALTIEATTHGRVLIEPARSVDSAGVLVAFHGYAQSADEILAEVQKIPGADAWTIVAPQALHRFYTRGDEAVVASWMTRQDREVAIADNVTYVNRVIDTVQQSPDLPISRSPDHPISRSPDRSISRSADRAIARSPDLQIVFLGFSQGVAMAYRAALFGEHAPAGVIALAGNVPPDVKSMPATRAWPRVLVGAGDADRYYTAEHLAADEKFFSERAIDATVIRFHGGHLFTEDFRQAISRWFP